MACEQSIASIVQCGCVVLCVVAMWCDAVWCVAVWYVAAWCVAAWCVAVWLFCFTCCSVVQAIASIVYTQSIKRLCPLYTHSE